MELEPIISRYLGDIIKPIVTTAVEEAFSRIPPPTPGDELISVKEACQLLRCSEPTFYAHVNSGVIKLEKNGRRSLVRKGKLLDDLAVDSQLVSAGATDCIVDVAGEIRHILAGHADGEVGGIDTFSETVVTIGTHVDGVQVTGGNRCTLELGVVEELGVEALAAIERTELLFSHERVGELAALLVASRR